MHRHSCLDLKTQSGCHGQRLLFVGIISRKFLVMVIWDVFNLYVAHLCVFETISPKLDFVRGATSFYVMSISRQHATCQVAQKNGSML